MENEELKEAKEWWRQWEKDNEVNSVYDPKGVDEMLVAYHHHRLDTAWVSVKERLPDAGEYVLVSSKNNGFHEDKFTGTIRSDGAPEFYGSREEYDITVTHWQKLPEPPKETK